MSADGMECVAIACHGSIQKQEQSVFQEECH